MKITDPILTDVDQAWMRDRLIEVSRSKCCDQPVESYGPITAWWFVCTGCRQHGVKVKARLPVGQVQVTDGYATFGNGTDADATGCSGEERNA